MKARVTQWILVFIGFWIIGMFKINVNVAIASMVIKGYERYDNYTAACTTKNFITSYESTETTSKSSVKQIAFHWNEFEQNPILSSFFWTHWMTQLPGGILTHYYGTKKVLGMAIFFCSISNILIPTAAKMGVEAIVSVRIFQGFVGGVTWPSVPPLTAKWVPPRERAIFLSSYLGESAGWPITYISSGYIIDKFGWHYLFYIQSILGVIWCLIWTQLAYDSPAQHPRISAKEKSHILNATSKSGVIDAQKLAIPWKSILTSKAIWMNFLACSGCLSALFTLFVSTPTYLKSTHGLDFKTVGIFCSIPHVARYIFASSVGLIGKHQRCIPRWKMRKIVTSICTFGAGSMILVIGSSSCYLALSMSAISLAVIFVGVVAAGPVAIFIDMGPNFTGILTGISGTVGALSALISPMAIAYLTRDNPTPLQWQKFFTFVGCICCIGGIAEVFFGTSEVQGWNTSKVERTSNCNDLSTPTILTTSSIRKSNKSRIEMISF